ncbi:MAG: aminotransferase class IV [Phycisphaerae bacterium]
MNTHYVYLDGLIVPAAQAAVSVYDVGLLHGASTFTTLRAHNCKPFRLEAHLDRLADDVQALGMDLSFDRRRLADGLAELIEANGLSEARCRITLTPGVAGEGKPTTLITADPMPDYPRRWYTEGLVVAVADQKQLADNPTFGHKTGCYLPRMLAMRAAAEKGAEEALWYTTENFLAEACMCNVFLVCDDLVLTPPLDTPVLAGTVRQVVLELCEQLGIESANDRRLTVREMLTASEAFLTGSTTGIRPVVQIEKHRVGDRKPGPTTSRLIQAYEQLLEQQCPPSEDADADS